LPGLKPLPSPAATQWTERLAAARAGE